MELFEMDGGEFENRREALDGNSAQKKPQMNLSEPSSSTRELHLAKKDIGQFNKSKRVAESVKALAESQLFDAKKTVKDLSLRIEESKSRAKVQIRDMEKLKKPKSGGQEWALAVGKIEDYQYAEVKRELEYVKRELSKLKLDMAAIVEEKRQAEKETEASNSKMLTYSSSLEALKKEIEELNEEHVLVELARIEALKEFGAIEAQRKEQSEHYSSKMEETRKKMSEIIQEIDREKELQIELAVTTSDVNVLQGELYLVKEMDKRVQKIESFKHFQTSSKKEDESYSPSLLQSVTEELEVAKKELASIREEGFQFMASMDVIRDELKHVADETARLKKTEEKEDLTVQNLNSKLLRAKAKLEAASASEEKAKLIASNLSPSLEQLKTEAAAAKKERELIDEETVIIKAEIQKTESEVELAEERLQDAIKELEAVKSSEATALENLKTLIVNTVKARASASQHSSTIRISSFEYEYLKGRAIGAEEIADKKVAAAQAWIEAFKASEKEILMKSERAQREIRELRVEEEQGVYGTERSLSAKRVVEGELQKWRQKGEANFEPENTRPENPLPRKSMNKSGNTTPGRRARFRKTMSLATRHSARSPSVTVKRRKEVMPHLAKFFSNKEQ